jgi:hypothetical protein
MTATCREYWVPILFDSDGVELAWYCSLHQGIHTLHEKHASHPGRIQ